MRTSYGTFVHIRHSGFCLPSSLDLCHYATGQSHGKSQILLPGFQAVPSIPASASRVAEHSGGALAHSKTRVLRLAFGFP